jgi:50S ribosome-binding GTPase
VHVCVHSRVVLSDGCARQGYTNAGKSSLIEALTGADLGAEDALFATLDATARVRALALRAQFMTAAGPPAGDRRPACGDGRSDTGTRAPQSGQLDCVRRVVRAVLGCQSLVASTSQAVTLPSGASAIMSDTVGFISDLPVQLLDAFKVTCIVCCLAPHELLNPSQPYRRRSLLCAS